jgi:hypothetical protein
MRRIGAAVGAVLVLVGVFWTGRESSHGLRALWEHWWCPVPLAFIALGAGTLIAARWRMPAA